jgi:hypothetical protein
MYMMVTVLLLDKELNSEMWWVEKTKLTSAMLSENLEST